MKEYKTKIIDTLMEEVLQRDDNLPTGIALENQIFLTIPDVPEAINPGAMKSAIETIANMIDCPCDDVTIEQDGPTRTFSVVIYSGLRVKKQKEERVLPVPTPEEEAALRQSATQESTKKEIVKDIADIDIDDDFFSD